MINFIRISIFLLGFVFCPTRSGMAGLPPIDWPVLNFSPVVTNAFNHPTIITHAGDNSGRLFVGEQAGQVQIIQGGDVLTTPFLNISNRVLSADGEQGLLGLTFPPGYITNRHFYVNYTRKPDGALVVSRFFLTATNANVADTNSEQIIKVIPKQYTYHNGGQLAFGSDGFLYIAVGDGGPEKDPQNLGQTTSTFFGKILRIDVESGILPYAIPTHNPFAHNPDYAPEIWALGLRNPWRFSFDRLTGDLYIGDVGQNNYEEIDFQAADSVGGQNYGWRILEGTNDYQVPNGFTNFAALTPPVAVYSHSSLPTDLTGAVIGGYVYRGPSLPRMDGLYFYADFQAGWIWGMKHTGTNWQSFPLLNPTPPTARFSISTFGEDDAGQIYIADYFSGAIYQMQDLFHVWKPAFSPVGGIINSNIVRVSCVTPGAEIHYTTNGVDPTLSDPVVPSEGFIYIVTASTNKLRAFRPDLIASDVAVAIFTNMVAPLIFSPPAGPIPNNTPVSILCATPNAVIHYTLDGTAATTNSPVYSTPVLVNGGQSVWATAVAAGYRNSSSIASYTPAQASFPDFSPSPGPITNGTQISLVCSTPGATIYYTLDGSNPTTHSTVYTGSFLIKADTFVQALATANGYVNSGINYGYYPLAPTATPKFNPPAGPITNGTMVTISCDTPGTTLFFTTNGTAPTSGSPIYNAPLILTGNQILQALATNINFATSTQSVEYDLWDPEKTVVTTIAGSAGHPGSIDGPGLTARFNQPQGICVDRAGTIFIADTYNSLIRRLDTNGLVTTLAGNNLFGFADGLGTNALFFNPIGICVNVAGDLFVADSGNRRIRRITPAGVVSTFSGNGTGGDNDGNAEAAEFYSPKQISIDNSGNLYVGDAISVRQISTNGSVTTFQLNYTYVGDTCVAAVADEHTNIFATSLLGVVDELQPGISEQIYAGGTAQFDAFADGPRLVSKFSTTQSDNALHCLIRDGGGNLYLSDGVRIRKINSAGWVSTLAGSGANGFSNGRGLNASFSNAAGLAIDVSGVVYVADAGNSCIRKISPDTAGIGIADDWQLAHFGYIGIQPDDDPDHDGASNYAEFWAGTDPNDPNSVFKISSAVFNNGGLRLGWNSVSGKNYLIQWSSDLITWRTLGDAIPGTGSLLSFSAPIMSQQSTVFYRVSLVDF